MNSCVPVDLVPQCVHHNAQPCADGSKSRKRRMRDRRVHILRASKDSMGLKELLFDESRHNHVPADFAACSVDNRLCNIESLLHQVMYSLSVVSVPFNSGLNIWSEDNFRTSCADHMSQVDDLQCIIPPFVQSFDYSSFPLEQQREDHSSREGVCTAVAGPPGGTMAGGCAEPEGSASQDRAVCNINSCLYGNRCQ